MIVFQCSIDFCVKSIAVEENLREKLLFFHADMILALFVLFRGELQINKKKYAFKSLRAPSIWNHWVCLLTMLWNWLFCGNTLLNFTHHIVQVYATCLEGFCSWTCSNYQKRRTKRSLLYQYDQKILFWINICFEFLSNQLKFKFIHRQDVLPTN